jgi:molecular chaperone GrpE
METFMNNEVDATVEAVAAAPEAELPPADQKDAEIEALKKELADANAKVKEYLDGWQRARAEFANYKRRQESDNMSLRGYATDAVVARLLPVLDDFERAARTLPHALQGMTWIEGVLLIHRKLQLILDSEGVKLIEVAPNAVFDPTQHEAISHDAADGVDSGHIIEEVQKGYKRGDRVVRPTLVRVAK